MNADDPIPESGPFEGFENRTYSDFIVDRVDNFQDKFGARHLYLAMHAAFPVSLPPELVYLIRDNFQYDSKGNFLDLPFEAVPDLLLSEMCQEVGHEVYQMEPELRQYLLKRLRDNPRFGEDRMKVLGSFITQYYGPDLSGGDLDRRNVAESQLWASNLQTDSSQGVSQLSELLEFAQNEGDNNLQYRLNNLLNQYEVSDKEEQLFELKELKNFAKGNALNLMGLKEEASDAFSMLQQTTQKIQIGGRGFELPEIDARQKNDLPEMDFRQDNKQQFIIDKFEIEEIDVRQQRSNKQFKQEKVDEVFEEDEEDEGPKIWLVHHSEDIELAMEIVGTLNNLGFRDVATSALDLYNTIYKYQRGIEDGIIVLEGTQGIKWREERVGSITEIRESGLIQGSPECCVIAGHPNRKDEMPQYNNDWSVFDVNKYYSNPMWQQFAERVIRNFVARTQTK